MYTMTVRQWLDVINVSGSAIANYRVFEKGRLSWSKYTIDEIRKLYGSRQIKDIRLLNGVEGVAVQIGLEG